ncbi:MAG: DUF167 domain-containing protein [Thermoproteota archaeon]|nr:MAG: DUF167 domain-containing protein [Candidatus Korarchaeota archaeon]
MRVRVKVIARSKSAGVIEEQGEIIVKVKLRPERGKANEEARRLIALYFGVKPSKVRLVAGETSRNKVFEIDYEKGR